MMRIGTKIGSVITAVLMMLALFPAAGYAHARARGAEVNIKTNPAAVQAGKLFTVTVTFTGTGDAIGTLQASLRYDADLMEYKSGGGNAVQVSNGSGGISDNGSETADTMRYSLNFLALKTGTASFAVTSSEITGFSSNMKLGNPRGEISIPITAAPPQESQPPDPLEITLDGQTYYLQQDIQNMDLPEGYRPEKYFFNGTEVQVAFNPENGITLLYLTDATGNTGFYVYDIPTRTVYPYVAIQTGGLGYTVLPAGEEAPEGYEPITMDIGNHTVSAWKRAGGDTAFFILYAKNMQGTAGYYIYDKTEGTLQRALISRTAPQTTKEAKADATTPQPENDDATPWPIYILAALAAILLITVILLGIRLGKKKGFDT